MWKPWTRTDLFFLGMPLMLPASVCALSIVLRLRPDAAWPWALALASLPIATASSGMTAAVALHRIRQAPSPHGAFWMGGVVASIGMTSGIWWLCSGRKRHCPARDAAPKPSAPSDRKPTGSVFVRASLHDAHTIRTPGLPRLARRPPARLERVRSPLRASGPGPLAPTVWVRRATARPAPTPPVTSGLSLHPALGQKKRPRSGCCGVKLDAGAGFEPTTFGL